jgi:hypothetical protein
MTIGAVIQLHDRWEKCITPKYFPWARCTLLNDSAALDAFLETIFRDSVSSTRVRRRVVK